MRQFFAADWAFSIRGAIEEAVRQHFPSHIRQWPLLQVFDFEAYAVVGDHFVVVLRDKLSGMVVGSPELKPFPYSDHPPLPVSAPNVSQWSEYLIDKFSLRNEDCAMILPIHDSGRSDPAADFALFQDCEKQIWRQQLQLCIARQGSTLQPTAVAPVPSGLNTRTPVTFNIYGSNSRVNINTADSSTNVVNEAPYQVLEQLITAISNASTDRAAIEEMVASVGELRKSYGTTSGGDCYTAFMSVLADHIQVFGPIVAPYLPQIAQYFTR